MFTFLKRWKLKRLLNQLKKYQHLRENGDANAKVVEIKTLHQITRFFSKQKYNKNFPNAKLQLFEYSRAAASLNDAEAQFACAQMCFDVGRFYENWCKSNYATAAHERYMQEAFSMAFDFLNAAEANQLVAAKRYKGLIYVHGWGVPADTSKGFQLILESIEMENAWAKATKIIDKLGLNSPAFFQALTQYQAKK